MSSDMVILPDGWSLIKDIPQQDMCQVEVRFTTPDGGINSLVYQFETTEDGTGSILDSGGNNIGTWDDLISTMMYGDCCPYAWTYFKSAWGQKNLQSENERLKDELRRVKKMLVRVIGDHDAPSDCYSTGPLEGNRMDDICPSCEGLHYLNHPDTEKI